jgi:hypothetical protein
MPGVRALILGPAVLAIAAATLVPLSPPAGWERHRFGTCLFCGELGGLDAINNVLLYLPLGATLAAIGCRLRRVAVIAAGMAATVELAQFAGLTGRYPSYGDVLFNTLGAVLAATAFATRRVWLTPSPGVARVATPLAAALFVGVAIASSWLLGLSVPDGPLYSQWAPRRAVPFAGQIHAATLDGHPISVGPLHVERAARFRSATRLNRTALAVDVTPPPVPPRGFAPIVRVVTDDRVHLALGQSAETLMFVPTLRSRELGLRNLVVATPFPSGSVLLDGLGVVERDRLQVSVTTSDGRVSSRRVNLTVGLAWATLLPVGVTIGPWHVPVSASWLLVMAFPVGFYASASRSWHWQWLAPLALACALTGVPAATGLARTGWLEWAGAVTGVSIGAVTGLRRRRARFVHRGVADTWTAELRRETD